MYCMSLTAGNSDMNLRNQIAGPLKLAEVNVKPINVMIFINIPKTNIITDVKWQNSEKPHVFPLILSHPQCSPQGGPLWPWQPFHSNIFISNFLRRRRSPKIQPVPDIHGQGPDIQGTVVSWTDTTFGLDFCTNRNNHGYHLLTLIWIWLTND